MPVLFGPDEGVFPLAELPLDGCRWCGVITKYEHMQRWAPKPVGWHTWTPLEQQQIKERMLARRAARLAAEPYRYHATTAWAADDTGESADPYCADCGKESCPRWNRVHDRLTRQRQGLPRRVRRSRKAVGSGWGGEQSWPF
jgi:hypothetical protein